MKKWVLTLGVLACLHAGAQQVTIGKKVEKAMAAIDTNMIRNHIAYLADDRLRGRLPGTEGYQVAVDYVSDQFRSMGVQPGGDNGMYTQRLVLRRSLLQNKTALAILQDNAGNRDTLAFQELYTPAPHPMLASTSAEAQLVFAGYGVEIPGQYSDYDGMDVKGRIVVLVAGAPQGLHSTLSAHFANVGNKVQTAAAKGAVGVILINPSARPAVNPQAAIQGTVALDPAKTKAYGRGFTGNLPVLLNGTGTLLNRLFMGSGKNLATVLSAIRQRQHSSFVLPYKLSVSYQTSHTDFESYNVVGLIPGTDAKLRQEYVVHTAHLDHVGVGRVVNGDSIYNGAHDNASGVASLLEIARIYKTSDARPRRSILIVMVTAEEMGLLGSSYFAANPTVPKNSIVANVNTDMPTVIAPLLSVVPLGAEHSSLMGHVEFAAGRLGLGVEQDPEPAENRFVRSDQYSFVMNGIPALHVKYGNKSNIPGFDLGAYVKQWRAKYYHQSADGMDGIFNFTAAKTYVQLNFLISYSVAQTTQRPAWNAGDLFGAVPR